MLVVARGHFGCPPPLAVGSAPSGRSASRSLMLRVPAPVVAFAFPILRQAPTFALSDGVGAPLCVCLDALSVRDSRALVSEPPSRARARTRPERHFRALSRSRLKHHVAENAEQNARQTAAKSAKSGALRAEPLHLASQKDSQTKSEAVSPLDCSFGKGQRLDGRGGCSPCASFRGTRSRREIWHTVAAIGAKSSAASSPSGIVAWRVAGCKGAKKKLVW